MEKPQGETLRPYRFNSEEMKVIRECGRESFFQRCLPLSTIFGAATYYAVKTGYLKPSAKFGATPKIIIAGFVGYFLGKISYQATCLERIMQIPNSPMGEMLRKRKAGNTQYSSDAGLGQALSLAPFGSLSNSDVYPDSNPSASYDLDAGVPQMNGLDDSFRPSLDNPGYEEVEMPIPQKHVTTYEELRKQNREEYVSKRTGNYKESPKPASVYVAEPTSPPVPRSTGKNKYGDDME